MKLAPQLTVALPVFRALQDQDHNLLLVYLELTSGMARTPAELGLRLNRSPWTIAHSLRTLEAIGVVEESEDGWEAQELADEALVDVLSKLATGGLVADTKNCVISGNPISEPPIQGVKVEIPSKNTLSKAAPSALAESTYGSGATSSALESAAICSSLLVVESKTQSITESKTQYTKSDKVEIRLVPPHKRTKVVIAHDEFRPVVERVQAFANQLFGTKHSLYTTGGQELGKTRGSDSRYSIIRRALADFGFNEDQLCGALTMAAKDPWWSERKIRDTIKLLRKAEHIQNWVDRWERGEAAATGKWSKKQTGLGANGARPDPTKLVEEVF